MKEHNKENIKERYERYCEMIGKKTYEKGKIEEFFEHMKSHMRQFLQVISRKELISLYNFTQITRYMFLLDEKECLKALQQHHEKTKSWSIGEDGSFKEPSKVVRNKKG